MKRIAFIVLILSCIGFAAECCGQAKEDRQYTIKVMQRIVDPVLIPLSQDKLKEVMPVFEWESKMSVSTTYLQAFGRSIAGLSPWLSLPDTDDAEGQLRKHYIELIQKCLINASNPEAKDYMFDNVKKERIVHAAYVAYSLLLIGDKIFAPLTDQQKANVIAGLKTHRKFQPFDCNWLLFPSTIEAAIWKYTGQCDIEAIKHAVDSHKKWYAGDGLYQDGHHFHWDYYNSYVIHPLLLETLKVCKEMDMPEAEFLPTELGRANRYAIILEHMISPEGTYPVIGRSSVYRFCAFQHIGYLGCRWGLPDEINTGSTRAALTAVIRNIAEAPGTFDENGWLNPGIFGHQENARDVYSTLGALYMCTMGLSHLGMPADSVFWTEPAGKWFQQRVWSGENIHSQHEYYGK